MAARMAGLSAVTWSLPESVAASLNRELGAAFLGRPEADLGAPLTVDRTRQRRAIAEQRTQSLQNPVLWRRLELQGTNEWLRSCIAQGMHVAAAPRAASERREHAARD